MGNQPSSSGQRSSPQSPIESRGGRHSHGHGHGHGNAAAANLQPGGARDFNPRRRGSIQPEGLTAKATAAPPSASLHTATTVSSPAASSKGGTDVTSALRAAHDQSQQHPQGPDSSRMGAEQSRHRREPRDKDRERERERERERDRDRDRDREHPPPAPPSEKPRAPKPPAPSPQSISQSQSQPRDVPTPANALAPQQQQQLNDVARNNNKSSGEAFPPSDMAVPAAPIEPLAPRIMPASPTPDYFLPAEPLFRPPRLPLPIEEEVHTPGSPIISPQDAHALDILGEGPEGDVRRAASMLSNTTLDEDELGDDLQGPQNVPTVPTLIEWEGPGERVYVTGTFVEWNRKFRLHRK